MHICFATSLRASAQVSYGDSFSAVCLLTARRFRTPWFRAFGQGLWHSSNRDFLEFVFYKNIFGMLLLCRCPAAHSCETGLLELKDTALEGGAEECFRSAVALLALQACQCLSIAQRLPHEHAIEASRMFGQAAPRACVRRADSTQTGDHFSRARQQLFPRHGMIQSRSHFPTGCYHKRNFRGGLKWVLAFRNCVCCAVVASLMDGLVGQAPDRAFRSL